MRDSEKLRFSKQAWFVGVSDASFEIDVSFGKVVNAR